MNQSLYLAVGIVLLALLLFWMAGRQQQQAGLPGGRVIYSDTRAWGELERPLYLPALGLTGKPDYLVEQAGATIPVEVKRVRNPEQTRPYDSHIYQLAAYCLLVSELYDQRPPYGLLHYTDGQHSRTYAIDFTPALEDAIRSLILEIQSQPTRKPIDRSHQQPQRCRGCGYREACDQRM